MIISYFCQIPEFSQLDTVLKTTSNACTWRSTAAIPCINHGRRNSHYPSFERSSRDKDGAYKIKHLKHKRALN